MTTKPDLTPLERALAESKAQLAWQPLSFCVNVLATSNRDVLRGYHDEAVREHGDTRKILRGLVEAVESQGQVSTAPWDQINLKARALFVENFDGHPACAPMFWDAVADSAPFKLKYHDQARALLALADAITTKHLGHMIAEALAAGLDAAGIETAMGEPWRTDSHEVQSLKAAVMGRVFGDAS